MACPSCGRRGNVPPDRLNSRLHCNKCDAVFHMDSGGKIVLGEPPHLKQQKEQAARARAAKRSDVDPIGSLVNSILRMPAAAKAAIALVVVGAAGFYGARALGVGSTKPVTVQQRVTDAMNQFIDGDRAKLLTFGAPGTEGQLGEWFDKVRPTLKFKGPQVFPNSMAVIDVRMPVDVDVSATSLQIPVLMMMPQPVRTAPGPAVTAEMLTLELPWVKDSGQWLIDGKALVIPSQAGKAAVTATTPAAGP